MGWGANKNCGLDSPIYGLEPLYIGYGLDSPKEFWAGKPIENMGRGAPKNCGLDSPTYGLESPKELWAGDVVGWKAFFSTA